MGSSRERSVDQLALGTPIPEGLAGATAVSKMSSLISMAFLVVSVGFAVAGQVILKAAMDRVGRIGSAEVAAFGEYVARSVREPRLWLGMFLFVVSAMFWLVVLSRVPLPVMLRRIGSSAATNWCIHSPIISASRTSSASGGITRRGVRGQGR